MILCHDTLQINQLTNNVITTVNTSPLQSSILPSSTVNSNPNDYLLISQSVNDGNESPVKIISKSNYSFTLPSF